MCVVVNQAGLAGPVVPCWHKEQVLGLALAHDSFELGREQHLFAALGFAHIKRFDSHLVPASQHVTILCHQNEPEHANQPAADVVSKLLVPVDHHLGVSQSPSLGR